VLASIEIAAGAIATSGDYERFFEHDGRRYSHLLDPRTGWPVESARSASVVAPLCVVAGSLATIAMLLEADALPFLEGQSIAYVAVDASGGVHRKPATAAST